MVFNNLKVRLYKRMLHLDPPPRSEHAKPERHTIISRLHVTR